MATFNFSSVFITFFAVVGPPKVLLTYAELSRTRSQRELVRLVAVSTGLAAAVGVLMALLAETVTGFFHVSDESLQLAGGTIFFLYAVGLVLGVHFGVATTAYDDRLSHPLAEGLRELSLPYVASPLAITAVLVESLANDAVSWRFMVAGAYLLVVACNAVSVLALAPLLRRTHQTSLEVLSRLLGLLLAAVGVELILNGLEGLGVHLAGTNRQ
ncbi:MULTISPECIES: MarC family protein [Kitasatospora]|uniref:MarC family protein n=1 Tax=Kitasatospora TaxID=2063 RepID=UPI000C714299|nr:MarC family protein [Kitasatospora sp. GP30]MDH6138947.1 multiple antibiotic resistance protein [Kitasatospora sp. GP30]